MQNASFLAAAIVTLGVTASAHAEAQDVNQETTPAVLAFEIKSLAGKPVDLTEKYRGKALLIVNVASRCGLTPQYEGLQSLQEKYGDDGFMVLGFPCNQFMGQEPGTAEQIQEFCKKNYGVTFDLFEKIEVNGDGAHELYQYLTELETKPQGPGKISWNFEKFLVDREGNVVGRFSPRTKPDDAKLVAAIEAALSTE